MCVMIFITSNLDKVRSNNFNVLCVSYTSEFQDDSVEKFQFDENRKQKKGEMLMIVRNLMLQRYNNVLTM